jgi:hypothetical protein
MKDERSIENGIFVEETDGTISLGKLRCKLNDIIKVDINQ